MTSKYWGMTGSMNEWINNYIIRRVNEQNNEVNKGMKEHKSAWAENWMSDHRMEDAKSVWVRK